MGDCSTHVIFYQGYWHLVYQLVYQDDNKPEWKSTYDFNVVCEVGEEEKSYKLENIA